MFYLERFNMSYLKWRTKIERKEGSMSLSEILIKLVGIILVVVGLGLILGAVGVSFIGASFLNPIASIVVGVVFIGVGIWIIRGGNVSL